MSKTDTTVRFEAVSKLYGDVTAVKEMELSIFDGEFFTLLGPSGCGKTTVLRMIAGLTKPTMGNVFIQKENVTNVPPYLRNVAMVFQDYALFPHLTVFENVAFGLKVRKVNRDSLRDRVAEALELVGLKGLDKRLPLELSGGQQQRVGLARALVVRPRVFLLDEPLSNLDAKLREQMCIEIRDIQRRLGLTVIYVTHDQQEALSISDRIAVMNAGMVEQCGEPVEIYDRPATRFVADFIGKANLLEVIISEEGIGKTGQGLSVQVKGDYCEGEKVLLVIRPERMRLCASGNEQQTGDQFNVYGGTIKQVVYLGSVVRLSIETSQKHEDLLIELEGGDDEGLQYAVGEPVTIGWMREDAQELLVKS